MKNRLLAAFLLLFAHCAIAADAANETAPGDFAFAVPIHDTGADALYRIVITPAVYQGATFPDLRDLRVFNAASPSARSGTSADFRAARTEWHAGRRSRYRCEYVERQIQFTRLF